MHQQRGRPTLAAIRDAVRSLSTRGPLGTVGPAASSGEAQGHNDAQRRLVRNATDTVARDPHCGARLAVSRRLSLSQSVSGTESLKGSQGSKIRAVVANRLERTRCVILNPKA